MQCIEYIYIYAGSEKHTHTSIDICEGTDIRVSVGMMGIRDDVDDDNNNDDDGDDVDEENEEEDDEAEDVMSNIIIIT